jgi:hypothetical protein
MNKELKQSELLRFNGVGFTAIKNAIMWGVFLFKEILIYLPSPSSKFPSPPSRLLPSSFLVPVPYARMREASLDTGKLCNHTSPGPVSVAKNNPSPPNKVFLIPPTN